MSHLIEVLIYELMQIYIIIEGREILLSGNTVPNLRSEYNPLLLNLLLRKK